MHKPSLALYYPSFSTIPVVRASPPSWMILLALKEAHLSCAFHVLDFAKGEHRSPAILALHPKGTVPILTCDQAVLTESMAILHFLASLPTESPLLPPSSDLSPYAVAVQRFHEAASVKATGLALLAWLVRHPSPQGDPQTFASLKAAFVQALEPWEGYAKNPYLAGEHLSLSDLVVFCYLAATHHLGLSLAPYLGLSGFYERMRGRPSVQATWPEGWAEPLDLLT